MTVDDKIIDEKLQYNINREVAKISALSSGKTDKYEYLTGEEILPSNQIQIKRQVKFPYSLLGKAFEKNPRKTRWYYNASRPSPYPPGYIFTKSDKRFDSC